MVEGSQRNYSNNIRKQLRTLIPLSVLILMMQFAYNNRGSSKARLGQHNEAIKDYDTAIRLNLNDALVYSNRGWSKARLGQHNEAIKDFDIAIRLNPNNALVHKNIELSLKKLSETHNS